VKRGFPRKWAIAFYVVLLASTGAVLWYMHSSIRRPPSLSPEERQDLAAYDDVSGRRLRHPLLGFSLAHPGPKFIPAPKTAHDLGYAEDTSTRIHAYTELDGAKLLVVTVSKRPGLDGAGFRKAVDSITHMFMQKTVAGFPRDSAVDTVENEVDEAARTASVHVVVADKAHIRIGAWGSRFGSDTDYLVMIIGVTPADDSLAPVVASLRQSDRPRP